ncbi:MAG: hypothetical protein ABS56_13695 [Lautropia sp. SCN 69-89]|nr:MAG: hypothetical protein ABS56_13695 [Lautropia sp. SCN 69-89]
MRRSEATTDPMTPEAPSPLRPGLAPVAAQVAPWAPLRWLALGWEDLRATQFRGLFYGVLFALMGTAIRSIYETQWQLTMGLTAGFFLLGPFVCTGLYELSRQRERGEPASLAKSLVCWRRNPGAIAFFAAILTFAMIVWARVSVVLFALASTTEFPTVRGMLAQIVSLANLEFLALWTAVGFVFASLVFAISVVSVPLMLDRRADTMMAVFSSARALATHPGPVYLWALLIVALVGTSLVLWLGLLTVTAPLAGHATWHAYRTLIRDEPAGG